MNVINIAQKGDAAFGVASVLAAIYLAFNGEFAWSGLAVISAVISFASAKYAPSRWLAKRMLRARLK